ncbi:MULTISPECIES: hypothetical protein [Pseudocitrobacter]|jgi:hypothetical protein|uniref:Uncharacterized protein n=2 Tax=Pseudocitrobacter TaxID=1504576 RepID=A0ABV0HH18_9ENTR|nr:MULTISPECIES: hypothetical protein [Pseudocitrobacter]AGB79262.1 hypothetical protein D782_3329 [Enterobacteriaceae bacterium strain FGI 57]MEB4675019.1 hypothetical protein [Enterobacteriaceae bacterium G50]MDF3829517.1 hypothetical protein [Pseudocitrobacter sp. 2023EL-00150]MEC5374869.1 hypothetical protein [Pseudocitrobacter sp. MW920760]UGS41620.1 hypothetical protein G163CM_23370 [Pseudocitrobacter corydidari]
MNDFAKIFEEMGLDKAILPILFRANRSTIHKYLDGSVNVPASAMSLIMLLQLVQKRNPELFAEWMVLSDFTIPPEVYLEQPEYWKGYKFTEHKVNKNVLEYLKENFPDGSE